MKNLPKHLIILYFSLIGICLYANPRLERFSIYDEGDGLSNGTVYDVYKDSFGYLWVATADGLNRFNGYEFKHYHHDKNDPNSLLSNDIRKIFEDSERCLWLYHGNGSFQRLELERNIFINLKESVNGLNQDLHVLGIIEDSQKRIWIITSNAGIIIYNLKSKTTKEFWKPYDYEINSISTFFLDDLGKLYLLNDSMQLCIVNTNTTDLISLSDYRQFFKNDEPQFSSLHALEDYVFVGTENNGVYVFRNHQFDHQLIQGDESNSLSSNLISDITSDHLGRVWISTSIMGINIVDTTNWKVSKVLESGSDYSISGDGINCLYRDSDDYIWVGGFRSGVSCWLKENEWLGFYSLILPYKGSNVRSVQEDNDENLWIVNGGDVTSISKDENEIVHVQSLKKNIFGIKSEKVQYLLIDRNEDFYFATRRSELIVKEKSTGKIRKWTSKDILDKSPGSVLYTVVEETLDGFIFLGTKANGFVIYDPNKRTFTRYNTSTEADYQINFTGVISIAVGNDSTLWIGTKDAGLVSCKLSNNTITYHHNLVEDSLFRNQNEFTSVILSDNGILWLGTATDGLFKYNVEKKQVSNYHISSTQNSKFINTIVEDLNGNLWIAQKKSIAYFDTKSNESYNMAPIRGYNGEEFIRDAGFRDSSGNIYFGLLIGYFKINPANVKLTSEKPSIQITDIKVLHDENSLTYDELNYPSNLNLKHFQNYISFSFSSLVFRKPKNISYQYKLEGLEDDWNTTSGERNVTYTNLTPGKYTFTVRSTNEYNIWVDNQVSLPIYISKPIWTTHLAYLLYAALLIAVGLVFRKYTLEKIALKKTIYEGRLEKKKNAEINKIKTRFFTNITHELKSPLSLIITPLQRMFQENDFILNKKKIEQFSNILRNATRLQGMINQLLDIANLQSGRMQLNFRKADIVLLIKNLVNEYQNESAKKNIAVHFQSSTHSSPCFFDPEVVEKIISNIISNAIKYTNEEGQIMVKLFVQYQEDHCPEKIKIVVEDNGVGIEQSELQKVFNRFYQAESSSEQDAGSMGIGLALVKELSQLHCGCVKVESTLGMGSIFEVGLAVNKTDLEEYGLVVEEHSVPTQPNGADSNGKDLSWDNYDNQPSLLIVEDDDDLRAYLKENLSKGFQIKTAGNAEQGIKLAIQDIPDLIITDLVLPGMNGDLLVQKLRADLNTSHIPIIMLTARTSEVAKISSYTKGVDDYITKPFNFLLLRTRIHNLLDIRKKIEVKFSFGNLLGENERMINPRDKKFLFEVKRILEENYHNSDFNLEVLENELNMTNLQFYRKIKAFTSQSGNHLIRTFRLNMAASMFDSNHSVVSDVAFAVGFSDPAYFTRCFTKEFGYSPSAYLKRDDKFKSD